MNSLRLMSLLDERSLRLRGLCVLMLLRYFMMLGIYLMSGKLLGLSIRVHNLFLLLRWLVNLVGDLRLQWIVLVCRRLLSIRKSIALHRGLKGQIFLLLRVLVHCC
jgi:hypothetical protein